MGRVYATLPVRGWEERTSCEACPRPAMTRKRFINTNISVGYRQVCWTEDNEGMLSDEVSQVTSYSRILSEVSQVV